jgi:hypothetical protein
MASRKVPKRGADMFTKAIPLESNGKLFNLARSALFLVLAVLLPSLGLPQSITGPLVNALLILAVETAGLGTALIVGILTPMTALLHGVLPLPLMVMIPFIALGNAMLTSVYNALRGRSRLLALVAGATAKLVLLSVAVTWLAERPLSLLVGGAAQKVLLPPSLVQMMLWPQLVTALAGGLLALGALRLGARK